MQWNSLLLHIKQNSSLPIFKFSLKTHFPWGLPCGKTSSKTVRHFWTIQLLSLIICNKWINLDHTFKGFILKMFVSQPLSHKSHFSSLHFILLILNVFTGALFTIMIQNLFYRMFNPPRWLTVFSDSWNDTKRNL